MGDDEAAWRVMLGSHLTEHILPLLQPSTLTSRALCQSVEHHLHCLHTVTCPQLKQLPVTCDILKIATLSKLEFSFQAEIHGCVQNEDGHTLCNRGDSLNKLPVVLVGVVRSDKEGVALVDTTGQVGCEMAAAVCTPNLIGRLILLTQWNWIQTQTVEGHRSSGQGYIEVQELVPLPPNETTSWRDIQPLSIARLKEAMRKKALSASKPLCVVGRVRALSECFRYNKSLYWLVELEDPLHPLTTHSILNQRENLLCLSTLLRVSEVYEFTELQDKVLNKGKSSEQRVLVTSQSTLARPHVSLEESQPPCKRSRSLENSSLLSQSSEHCNLDIADDSVGVRGQDLLSYMGTITGCVLPKAGVFELDGKIRVYLTHQTCVNQCRGLRVGARVELYNVRLLKVTAKSLKHLSGFHCCSRSTVRISHFSPWDTPHKMFFSENVLCALVRRYSVPDGAWLVEVYRTLRNRQLGPQTSYSLLNELSQALSLPHLQTRDIFTEFFSLTTGVHTPASLTHPPHLPLLSELIREVSSRTESSDFQWSSSEGMTSEECGGVAWGGCGHSYTPGTSWQCGRVRHSELPSLQLLVGSVQGNSRTGHIEIVDCSGRLPVIPAHSLTPHTPQGGGVESVLCGVGGTVLISEFDIVAERIQRAEGADSTEFSLYIRKMSVCSPVKIATAVRKDPSSSSSVPRPLSAKLMVEIVNKNQVHVASLSGSCSFTALADVFKQSSSKVRVALNFPPELFHMYSLINNGCVYELMEDPGEVTTLPSLEALVQNHVIEVNQRMRFHYVESVCVRGVQDVMEVVSETFLPAITTLANKHVKQSRSEDKLVSLRGTVIKRGHRLDLASLPGAASPPPPTVVFTVQSSTHPDTLMIYCKNIQTLTLGLVPGCVATFHSFILNTSKSGNIYCTSCSSSSVAIHSLGELARISGRSAVTAPMARLSTVLLHQLTEGLLNGHLTRRVVCVRGRIVSVQRVCVQYKCRACQCVVVNGRCMVACTQRRPSLFVDGRLVIEDGSGEAHVYVEDDLVRELLMVRLSDWKNVCELVKSVGIVTHTKPLKQVGSVAAVGRHDSSPLAQAQSKLSIMATNPAIQQTVKLYCQPFVSQGELKECVLGEKSRAIFFKEQRYNTLALPRLQLRAIAHLPLEGLSCVGECRRLIEEMTV